MVKLLNQTLKEWQLWTSRANLWIQNSVFDCMKTHKLESWPRDLRDFDLHRRPQIRSFTKLHLRTCSLGHVKTRRMSSQNIVRKLTHTRGRLFTQYIDYKMICHCICNLFSCWVQLQCFLFFETNASLWHQHRNVNPPICGENPQNIATKCHSSGNLTVLSWARPARKGLIAKVPVKQSWLMLIA